MKVYKEEQEILTLKKTEKIICNLCGRAIKKDGDDTFYDYIEVKKKWGYLSDYDGQVHSFDICQDCYKRLAEEFKVNAEISD